MSRLEPLGMVCFLCVHHGVMITNSSDKRASLYKDLTRITFWS
jgi:hypothetical protein